METEYGHEAKTREGQDDQDSIATQLREAIADVFEVQAITHRVGLGRPGQRPQRQRPQRQRPQRGQALRLGGRLRVGAEEAYGIIASQFKALEHTALLRRENDQDVVYAIPGVVQPTPSKRWVNVALFVVTVISVLFTGTTALGADVETLSELVIYGLTHLYLGLPAAVALLVPLLAHEFGHYLMARRSGVPATLPYFIPFPFPLSPLGTMGAIIRMKGPIPNRKTLLAVGAAGPLAGFVVAVPFLILGLALSPVTDFNLQTGLGIPENGIMLEGNSLLYGGLKLLMFGQWLPGGGKDVLLHPVAFSAWAALLVTAINLIPAGQLDGGHIAYALLGNKARWLTQAMLVVTVVMGFFWEGWWLWAVLIWFFGRQHAAPLDDITPLTMRQRALAVVALILFVLTFIPIPMQIIMPPGA
jgi:membrane-associated protease RseP (regulator of RpoE activity)